MLGILLIIAEPSVASSRVELSEEPDTCRSVLTLPAWCLQLKTKQNVKTALMRLLLSNKRTSEC